MADAALRADGVSKRYGERAALRDVTFAAGRGELLAIIGPNGAGKTTLLQIAAGALSPSAGTVSLPPAAGRLGAAAARAVLEALRGGEPAAVRAAGEGRGRRGRRRADARADRPRGAGRRRGRPAVRRQPAAGQHRDRPAAQPRRAAARRAVGLARSAPARAAVGLHRRPRPRGHGRRVLHARRRGGGALRRPGARARRRRAAVHGHPGRARARRRRRGATSSPPSSASSTTAATDALAAAQGPADPAPLAAAGRAADRLPDRDLAAGRARARPPAREAEGRVREPRAARRERASRSAASGSTSPTTRRGCSRRSTPCACDTREEAIEKVRSGEVLGAIVLPEDATERLRSTLGLGRRRPAQDRGLLQRVGPAQAAARREHDPLAAGRGQRRALGRRAARGGRLHRRDRHRRGGRAAAGRERSTSSACAARRRSSRPRCRASRRTRPSASR